MKYLVLTLPSKEKIYVNIASALNFYRNVFQVNEIKTTIIDFGNDYTLSVLETPEEIYDRL